MLEEACGGTAKKKMWVYGWHKCGRASVNAILYCVLIQAGLVHYKLVPQGHTTYKET
jgi:hypothetical protein